MPTEEQLADQYRALGGDPYCQTCYGYGYVDKPLGHGDDVQVACPQCVQPRLDLINSLPLYEPPSLAERIRRVICK